MFHTIGYLASLRPGHLPDVMFDVSVGGYKRCAFNTFRGKFTSPQLVFRPYIPPIRGQHFVFSFGNKIMGH